MELGGQVLDQLAEVHAVVSGEVEHQFAAVQRIFCVHQLHFQAVGGDALLADGVGLLHVGAVLAHTADVHCIGHADDRLDLAGEARHLVGGAHDLAALGAAGRGNDDVVALFDLEIAGIKIIGAAVFLEFYRNYFHGKFLYLFVRQNAVGTWFYRAASAANTATARRRLPLLVTVLRVAALTCKIRAARSGVRPPHCSAP